MNPIEVRIPDLGADQEATVTQIFVKSGDYVTRGNALLELETDKVALEIPAEVSGLIEMTPIEIGSRVQAGFLIATISADSGTADLGRTPSHTIGPRSSAPTLAFRVQRAPAPPEPIDKWGYAVLAGIVTLAFAHQGEIASPWLAALVATAITYAAIGVLEAAARSFASSGRE